jgi:hypothetical protein
MKIRQQTLYRVMVIISALAVLIIIGKADIGTVFKQQNFTMNNDFRIIK